MSRGDYSSSLPEGLLAHLSGEEIRERLCNRCEKTFKSKGRVYRDGRFIGPIVCAGCQCKIDGQGSGREAMLLGKARA